MAQIETFEGHFLMCAMLRNLTCKPASNITKALVDELGYLDFASFRSTNF